MGSVQGKLQYLTLVPIWVSLPDIPAGDPLGQIQGSPGVVVRWSDLELHPHKILLWSLPILVHI